MTKAEYDKWLKKQGIHPSQLKEKKKGKAPKKYKPKNTYSDYYENKDFNGNPIMKKEMDISKESDAIKKEIQRKRELILAMNMTGPRDLDYYVADIDQIHLVTKSSLKKI